MTIATMFFSFFKWAIPAETTGNGKDNVYNFFFSNVQCVVKAVQVNISNGYMKLQSMN